jgi:hypothetical protein
VVNTKKKKSNIHPKLIKGKIRLLFNQMIEFECVCEKRDLLKKEEDLNRC